jgi:microsomal dipeptidase-like Zn-dependent dipeptidase
MKMFGSGFWPATTRTDFPKLTKGGMDVILSTIYVPEQGWLEDIKIVKLLRFIKPKAWKKLFKRDYFTITDECLSDMEIQAAKYNETNPSREVHVVKSVAELDRGIRRGDINLIHSVEGSHSLQGPRCGRVIESPDKMPTIEESEVLSNLEHFYDRGVAYLTIAHFYPNCATFSPTFPYPEYGLKVAKKNGLFAKWDHTTNLTHVGESIVERMLELGMLIDVTHLTPPARSRVYEIVDHHQKSHCLIASHIGAYGVNPDPMNLTDWELKWFADHACTVGMIFMPYWLSPVDTRLGLKYLMQTVQHITNVAGTSVPGIGTDFDGMTDPPDEITDMSQMPRFTRELLSLQLNKQRLYNDGDIKNILGGNALRTIREGWGRKR